MLYTIKAIYLSTIGMSNINGALTYINQYFQSAL